MCGGSPSAPPPPAAVPEAPRAPDGSNTGETAADRDKRRRLVASGQGNGTILTGPRGVTEGAETSTKTLLGQ